MFHRIDAGRADDADIALLTALAIMARWARAAQKQKIFISDKVPAIRRHPRERSMAARVSESLPTDRSFVRKIEFYGFAIG